MTDYSELVKALRCRDAEFGYYRKCKYYGEASDNRCVLCDSDRLARDAAAAIEALQAEVERLKDSNEELREKQTYIDHYGAEWMTSAKDVPTAAYEHGYMDGRDEAMAKMEVQE